jgi:hypothetical protein
MKQIPSACSLIVQLFLLWSAATAGSAVHEATASPSGRYKLASVSIYQDGPKDSGRASLGSNISLTDRSGKVISTCFSPSEAYADVPSMKGRESWQTRGYWNDKETMVAVYSGGRTWSRVDFYSVGEGRIAILPHPNWNVSLFKGMPGYRGETTRLYEGFSKWIRNDTCLIKVNGTAFLDESQKERYPQFSYVVTICIALEGIQITEVKKEEG